MQLYVKQFHEVTLDELYDILAARADVFIMEQNCVCFDPDGVDKEAYHVYYKEDGKIVAYLRVIDKGKRLDEVSIGRVISLKRRCGVGSALMKEGLRVAKEKFGASKEKIDGFEDDFRVVAGFNTRDLGREEKTFRTSFVGEYEYIEFERIDSDAEFFLNGEKIGDNFVSYRVTGNHVRPYRFPIHSRGGRNELVIRATLLGGSKNPFSGYVRVGRKRAPKYEVSLYGGKARVFYRGRDAKITARLK